jgi:hypothetical protein
MPGGCREFGQEALDLLPAGSRGWFPVATNIALVMVGFLLGGGLSLADLRGRARLRPTHRPISRFSISEKSLQDVRRLP